MNLMTRPTAPPQIRAAGSFVLGGWVVALLPILIHFAFLIRYAVNIPKWDDHALRNFLVDYNQTVSWREKISLIFAQHNEHRIAYDRLITLIIYKLTGEINFVWLMVVGSFSLIGILAIFYKFILQARLPAYFFLPLPWLLLTLQHHENTFWGMAALQNFSVVFFLISSLFLISLRTERVFVLAVFMALMAIFTSGNGILVFPVGAGLLVLQKRWRALISWLVLSGVISLIYFLNYQSPPGNPPAPVGSVLLYLKGALGFLGAVADWQPAASERFFLPVLTGCVMGIAATVYSIKTLLKTPWLRGGADVLDYFILGVTVFVVTSAVVVTVGRIGFGEWILLTSRVKIYSAVLLLTLLVAVLRELPVRRQRIGVRLALFGAIAFNAWTTYLEIGEVIFHRQDMISQLFTWKYGRPHDKLPAYDRLNFPYRAPALLFEPVSKPNGGSQAVPVWSSIDSLYQTNEALVIEETQFVKPSGLDAGAYIQLRSDSLFLFPTRQHRNRSRRRLLTGGGYFAPGFTATIPHVDVPAGRYEVQILTADGQTLTEHQTNRTVTLPGNPSNNLPKNW